MAGWLEMPEIERLMWKKSRALKVKKIPKEGCI
jgi:hypothetical protein